MPKDDRLISIDEMRESFEYAATMQDVFYRLCGGAEVSQDDMASMMLAMGKIMLSLSCAIAILNRVPHVPLQNAIAEANAKLAE